MVDDKRSTSSYFIFIGGNLVIWRRKKEQGIITLSSA
jgi:hypothetical protein